MNWRGALAGWLVVMVVIAVLLFFTFAVIGPLATYGE